MLTRKTADRYSMLKQPIRVRQKHYVHHPGIWQRFIIQYLLHIFNKSFCKIVSADTRLFSFLKSMYNFEPRKPNQSKCLRKTLGVGFWGFYSHYTLSHKNLFCKNILKLGIRREQLFYILYSVETTCIYTIRYWWCNIA